MIFGGTCDSANGMYLRIAALTGAKNNSPASTTPPPIIIACGSIINEYDAHAKPSQSACLLNAANANSLPAFAAFVNAVPDNLPSPKFNTSSDLSGLASKASLA